MRNKYLPRSGYRFWPALALALALAGLFASHAARAAEPYAAATRLARQGIDALLNVELDRATAIFDRVHKTYPDYPLSGFLHGTVYWVRAEAAQGAEQEQARNMALKHLERAVTEAEAALRKTPDDPYWRLDLGMSLFFAARIYNDQGKTFVTYNYARRGRDILRELVKTHPHMEDAYFVLGMYEYIAGSIPRGLRWLAALLDISGDRNLGIKYLERATAHAPVMAPEAARILLAAAAIQPQYNRPCEYRPLALYTDTRFNGNPYFSMALQLIDAHCGYPEQALRLNGVAQRKFLGEYPGLRSTLELVQLQAYRTLGDIEHIDAMKPIFIKRDPAFWYLARAQALDVRGERAKAKKIYDDLFWAASSPDDYPEIGNVPDWVLDQVELCRKKPFQRPQPTQVADDASLRLEGVSPTEFQAVIAKFKIR